MFAQIATWKLESESQTVEGFSEIFDQLADCRGQLTHEHGLLDGYHVRIGPETVMTIFIFAQEADAEDAWSVFMSTLASSSAQQINLTDLQLGEATVFPASLNYGPRAPSGLAPGTAALPTRSDATLATPRILELLRRRPAQEPMS